MRQYVLCSIICLWLLPPIAHGQRLVPFTNDTDGLSLAHNSLFDSAGGVIVGELHDARITPEIKLALIKYLHENKGVNDVFMEVGHAAAYLYNCYLNTGDTAFITHPSLVYAGGKEGLSFWRRLYTYNRAAGFTITIHGFDFERMEFVKVLRLLKPMGAVVPDKLLPMLQYIDTLSTTTVNGHNLVNSYARISYQLQLFKEELKQYYGEDFSVAEDILCNENKYEAYPARNKNMFTEVNKAICRGKMAHFLLFAGAEHCNKQDTTSLAARLTTNTANALNVLTMVMLCRNCDGITLKTNKLGVVYSGPKEYADDRTAMGALFHLLNTSSYSPAIIRASQTQFRTKKNTDLIIMADK